MDGEFENVDTCYYNGSNACNFGIAVGVIGFVMCLVFLVKDVLYVVIDFSNNILVRFRLINGNTLYVTCIIYMYVCTHVCTHVHVHVCMYVHVYIVPIYYICRSAILIHLT